MLWHAPEDRDFVGANQRVDRPPTKSPGDRKIEFGYDRSVSDVSTPDGLPNYRDLDKEGEARKAAERMEARSAIAASEGLFEGLILPLLDRADAELVTQETGRRVLEVGCGTAALSRRLARHANDLHLVATDKSPGMIEFARERIEAEGLSARVRALVLDALLLPKKLGGPVDRILWSAPYANAVSQTGEEGNVTHVPGFDTSMVETSLMDISEVRSILGASSPNTVLEEDTLDEDDDIDTDDEDMGFNLIFSSVMMPYLDEDEQRQVVDRLATRLGVGGVLCFLEQELLSDFISLGDIGLERRALGKDVRRVAGRPAHALRGMMREVGLELLDEERALWSCNSYNPYVQNVLETSTEAAVSAGRMTSAERTQALEAARDLDAAGDFSYGITYRQIAGVRRA